MQQYGVREVEKLLRLPRSTIRSLVKAGFVSPARGPRNTFLFSFQDLIVLRTAQALAAAKVPAKRITRSLKDLRRHLPGDMPLSGLSIGAVGRRSRCSPTASGSINAAPTIPRTSLIPPYTNPDEVAPTPNEAYNANRKMRPTKATAPFA